MRAKKSGEISPPSDGGEGCLPSVLSAVALLAEEGGEEAPSIANLISKIENPLPTRRPVFGVRPVRGRSNVARTEDLKPFTTLCSQGYSVTRSADSLPSDLSTVALLATVEALLADEGSEVGRFENLRNLRNLRNVTEFLTFLTSEFAKNARLLTFLTFLIKNFHTTQTVG